MEIITCHTYGAHAYMKLMLNGEAHEIDVYWGADGEKYKTDSDGNLETRNAIIDAFKALY